MLVVGLAGFLIVVISGELVIVRVLSADHCRWQDWAQRLGTAAGLIFRKWPGQCGWVAICR
jgi:hypothetical protein